MFSVLVRHANRKDSRHIVNFLFKCCHGHSTFPVNVTE